MADKKASYAKESDKEAAQLRSKNKEMSSLPIGGKSAKMGESFYFNKDGSAGDTKAASAAYDARMNQRESAAEDQEESSKRNSKASRPPMSKKWIEK